MKCILTRKIIAKDVLLPGSIVELTVEQAASPMYRNRATPFEAGLEVETDLSGNDTKQPEDEPVPEQPKPRGRGGRKS